MDNDIKKRRYAKIVGDIEPVEYIRMDLVILLAMAFRKAENYFLETGKEDWKNIIFSINEKIGLSKKEKELLNFEWNEKGV